MTTIGLNDRRRRITGVIFIALGAIALLFPLTTGMTLNFFFGVILAVAGVAHFINSYRAEKIRNRWGQLGLTAVLGLIGLLLIFVPQIGISAFTLLLSLAFIIQGGVLIYSGVFSGSSHRRGLTIAGAVSLIAGLLLIANWPGSGNWIVGVLAGINLLVLGLAMLTSRVEIHRASSYDDGDVIDVQITQDPPPEQKA